jgi:hypothetical protein
MVQRQCREQYKILQLRNVTQAHQPLLHSTSTAVCIQIIAFKLYFVERIIDQSTLNVLEIRITVLYPDVLR